MSTDIMYFTFSPKNAQFFYEKSVILSGFWTARNIFFIVYAYCFLEKVQIGMLIQVGIIIRDCRVFTITSLRSYL